MRCLLVVIGIACSCGPASSSSTAPSPVPSQTKESRYPALVSLGACVVTDVDLSYRQARGYDTETYAWQVRCPQGTLEIVERAAIKNSEKLRLRAEGQAAKNAIPDGKPTFREIDVGRSARTTPVEAMSGLLFDEKTEPLFVVTSLRALGRHGRRAVACMAKTETLDWCHSAIRSLFKSGVGGLHESWTSYGSLALAVPSGCVVPAPNTIACQNGGLVWTTKPSRIDTLVKNEVIEKTFTAKGGRVERRVLPCRISGRPAQCDMRTYTIEGKSGPISRYAIFAKSIVAGKAVGIGCDAGHTPDLPPVCQVLIQLP